MTKVKMTMTKVIVVMKAVRSLFMQLKNKELNLIFFISELTKFVSPILARETFTLKTLINAIVNMVPMHSRTKGSNNALRPGDIRCYLRSTANDAVDILCQYQQGIFFDNGAAMEISWVPHLL